MAKRRLAEIEEMKKAILILGCLVLTLACARQGMVATVQSVDEANITFENSEIPLSEFQSPKTSETPKEKVSPQTKIGSAPAPKPSKKPDDSAVSKNPAKPESPSKPADSVIPKKPDDSVKPSNPPAPKQGFDPSQLVPGTRPQDFIEKGNVVPTIYYQATMVDDETTCAAISKVSMKSKTGSELMKVCFKTLAQCLLQGSCLIIRHGEIRSFNVAGLKSFVELKDGDCQFGFGVQSICLDPFYSVAADMRYHKAGEVLFLPALVGGVLPDGSKHSGFMVVRDRGGAIKGPHRFDFYSGPTHYRDEDNLFAKLKLGDKGTRLIYYQVKGESARAFLESRNYPKLPLH